MESEKAGNDAWKSKAMDPSTSAQDEPISPSIIEMNKECLPKKIRGSVFRALTHTEKAQLPDSAPKELKKSAGSCLTDEWKAAAPQMARGSLFQVFTNTNNPNSSHDTSHLFKQGAILKKMGVQTTIAPQGPRPVSPENTGTDSPVATNIHLNIQETTDVNTIGTNSTTFVTETIHTTELATNTQTSTTNATEYEEGDINSKGTIIDIEEVKTRLGNSLSRYSSLNSNGTKQIRRQGLNGADPLVLQGLFEIPAEDFGELVSEAGRLFTLANSAISEAAVGDSEAVADIETILPREHVHANEVEPENCEMMASTASRPRRSTDPLPNLSSISQTDTTLDGQADEDEDYIDGNPSHADDDLYDADEDEIDCANETTVHPSSSSSSISPMSEATLNPDTEINEYGDEVPAISPYISDLHFTTNFDDLCLARDRHWIRYVQPRGEEEFDPNIQSRPILDLQEDLFGNDVVPVSSRDEDGEGMMAVEWKEYEVYVNKTTVERER